MIVSIDINLSEEVLEVPLDGPSIECLSVLELASNPSLEFSSFKGIVSIEVVAKEDLFDKGVAIVFHSN